MERNSSSSTSEKWILILETNTPDCLILVINGQIFMRQKKWDIIDVLNLEK